MTVTWTQSSRMNVPLTINSVCAKQTTGEHALKQLWIPNKTEIEREIMTKFSLRFNYAQIFLDPSWSLISLPALRSEEHFMWLVFFWIIHKLFGFLPYILTELWMASFKRTDMMWAFTVERYCEHTLTSDALSRVSNTTQGEFFFMPDVYSPRFSG